MSENKPQDIKQDMSDMYDYFSDDKEFQKLIPEIDASMIEITPTAPIIDCLKTEETKVKRKRKYVECSICLQMKRSDRIKKHMKTHEVSNTYDTIVFVSRTQRRKSKYRKHVVCCICERVMRTDQLKRHMRKISHAVSDELDTIHGSYIEKLSTESERKHDGIMDNIPEQYLATKKHYSLDTYQRMIKKKIVTL